MARPTLSDAGDGVEAVHDGLVERFDFRVLVAGRLRIEVDDVAVGCIQLHVDVLGFVEALGEEAGGNEQHERERGLQDDECALKKRGSLGGGARVGAQGFGGLRARGHQRRREAEEDASHKRKRKGEADDQRRRRSGDRHVVLIGKGERQQRVRSEIGDGEAEQAADTREKNAFRQQLAHDAAALRAER